VHISQPTSFSEDCSALYIHT